MTTTDDIITDIIRREGPATDDPLDIGGRTAFGISETANPQAWADGRVTEAEARAIYERKYVNGPRFNKIQDPTLKAQLVDFGVNSGPLIAIMKLQFILGVDVDGVIGPQTLGVLDLLPAADVNNALMVERVKMIGRIVQRNPSQLKYLSGWLNRALDFMV